MSKKLLLIIAICFNVSVFSQSKEETKEWIVDKYNNYERAINKFNSLAFDDDYIVYQWVIDERFGAGKVFKIKIKEIKKIEIRSERLNAEDKVGWVKLVLHFDSGKGLSRDLDEENFSYSGYNNFYILLDSKFLNNDLPARMEKAFLHLVKLYGGKAIVKKEAF